MVVIRLARGGAKKRPFFNVVVADSRRARDGRFIERLGFYNPKAPVGRESLRIDRVRLAHWQSQGAQLSSTAARLLRQHGKQATAGAQAASTPEQAAPAAA
jgi:small subunit ribosomal protein S16